MMELDNGENFIARGFLLFNQFESRENFFYLIACSHYQCCENGGVYNLQ